MGSCNSTTTTKHIVISTKKNNQAIIERAKNSKILALDGPPKAKQLDLEGVVDLRSVSIRGLGLREVPRSLKQSKRTLKTLKLSSNELVEIPKFFQEFEQLMTLDLAGNSLSMTEISFQLFPRSLQALNLSKNRLTSIGNLEHLTALVDLNLSENPNIDSIEAVDWSKLTSLEELNVHGLKLMKLPVSLSRAPRLTVISAQNNTLSARDGIPEEILNDSPLLHTLHLEGNDQITLTVFMNLPGVDAYLNRRKAKVDKQLAGGTFSPDLAVI